MVDAVTIKNYSFTYPGEESPALKQISLRLAPGTMTVLCGPTGSGKTTLLRSLKEEICPAGEKRGEVLLSGLRTGFVAQDPENQLVMDTVRHELAFGLENMGLPGPAIRRRMAETAHFFGIDSWMGKKVSELSGGQKQILNLAAVMVMQPGLLLLDEPTSQLDPIAAGEFMQMLRRIRQELGVTVLLSEHRMEEVLSEAGTVVWLERGEICFTGKPEEFAGWLFSEREEQGSLLPAPARIWKRLEGGPQGRCPLSVGEGRRWAAGLPKQGRNLLCVRKAGKKEKRPPALEARELWFCYQKQEGFVLRGAELSVAQGEIHAVLGGNGSGKTTLLYLLAGARKALRGRVWKRSGLRTGLLTQNPKAMLTADSVWEEMEEFAERFGYGQAEIEKVLTSLNLYSLRDRHPYDLSGGEQQKTALAKLLLLRPDILLLDEPTKGLDGAARKELARLLGRLKAEGKTILMVTHDTEFAAETADTCSMLADGEIVCTEEGREFFTSNLFYTTQTNRMLRGIAEGCVLPEDVAYE